MVKLMLDRATLMKMHGCYSPEIISAELTKNNEALVYQFNKYNKQDLQAISKLLHADSMLFLEVTKVGEKNPDKIKLWKDNATNFADLLNEIDDRKWSKNAGEKLFHEYQNLIIAGLNSKDFQDFDQIRDQAARIGTFIA